MEKPTISSLDNSRESVKSRLRETYTYLEQALNTFPCPAVEGVGCKDCPYTKVCDCIVDARLEITHILMQDGWQP